MKLPMTDGIVVGGVARPAFHSGKSGFWRRIYHFRFPRPFDAISGLVILFFIALTLYPVYRILSTLFYPNGHFDVSAFRTFADTPGAWEAVWQTAVVVGAATVVSMVIGGGIAWLNERTDARMGVVTDTLPFLPFLTPPIASAIGWVVLLSPTAGYVNDVIRHCLAVFGIHLTTGPFNIYTYGGLIFVYAVYMVPFAFMGISAGIRSMDSQLEEQSRTCGASTLRTLWKVVLPALKPAVGGAALLVVWTGFGMYAIPAAIAGPAGIHIMTVEIINFLEYGFPPQYGPAIVMSLIMVGFVAIAWYAQTRLVKSGHSATSGGRGGRQSPRVSLGVWKWPVRTLVLLYAFIATVLPAIALLLVVLNGYWTPAINWGHLSLAPFRAAIFDTPETMLALKNSFSLGLAGATIGIAVAAIVSRRIVRSRSRLSRTIDGTVKLPVIISHLVLGLGFILAFASAPFHLGGTWLILFLAYVALFMPQGTLTTDPIVKQVGMDLDEASSIAGAGPWRTFRKIYLPLMVPAITVGWALIFVRILGDLEISAVVAGTSNPTIGSQTLQLYSSGTYAGVTALSLILDIVSSALVLGVLAYGRRRSRWSAAAIAPTAARLAQ
jgi:iron(III) transport system permease protein